MCLKPDIWHLHKDVVFARVDIIGDCLIISTLTCCSSQEPSLSFQGSALLGVLKPWFVIVLVRKSCVWQPCVLCFLQEWGVTRLTFEYDSEPFGKERDAAIVKLAKEAGVEVVIENSHTLYDLDR